MSETKDEIAAERDALRAENERLRGQLAAAGARPAVGVAAPQHLFLSEGDRQELEIRGVLNIGGRLMTREEVLAELGDNQKGVEIADAPEGTRVDPAAVRKIQERPAILGVDYVYPSVEPGKIDPAVAGTPGINGPAADQK